MDSIKQDLNIITRSVKKVYNKDMHDFHKQYNLTTRNGDPGIRWDFINTNIENGFTNDNYKTVLVKRGYWNQIVIYNTYDKRLYFVMREDRYKTIKKDRKRNNLHLVQMLGSVNEVEENEAKTILKKKLPEYICKAKEYMLVTYEYNENDSKCYFKCRKITSKFKCSYKESWDSDLLLEKLN